jgi:hypothetical protein
MFENVARLVWRDRGHVWRPVADWLSQSEDYVRRQVIQFANKSNFVAHAHGRSAVRRRWRSSSINTILTRVSRRIMSNRPRISAALQGVLADLAFGAVSVGMMLPMEFPDKTAALLGAF